jgi:hypothetical protein
MATPSEPAPEPSAVDGGGSALLAEADAHSEANRPDDALALLLKGNTE